MNRKIVGVDLSLTATGVAVISQRISKPPIAGVQEFSTKLVCTGPINPKTNKPTEVLRDRVARSREIAADVWRYAASADLVVIEGLFTGKTAGKLIDRAATWMRIVDRCVAADVPIAVIAPTALKLPIGGAGTASKTEMISALIRLYPTLVLKSDNEVDALACAHLGAVALDWDVPTLERHRKVTWTEFPDITSAGALPIGPAGAVPIGAAGALSIGDVA